jgi:flagellar motor component MotA
MLSLVDLWVSMGIMGKLVVLGLAVMAVALPVLSVKLARRGEGARTIGAIAVCAPLLGVLGTVIGLINASVYLSHQPSVPVTQLAAGLAEALVTTPIGLAIGIAAVWLRVVCEGRAVRSGRRATVAHAAPAGVAS